MIWAWKLKPGSIYAKLSFPLGRMSCAARHGALWQVNIGKGLSSLPVKWRKSWMEMAAETSQCLGTFMKLEYVIRGLKDTCRLVPSGLCLASASFIIFTCPEATSFQRFPRKHHNFSELSSWQNRGACHFPIVVRVSSFSSDEQLFSSRH